MTCWRSHNGRAFPNRPRHPAPAPSAIATRADLAAARDLLAQFADLAPAIDLVDIILKSAAAGLRATPDLTAAGGGLVVLGLTAAGGTVQALPGLERLTLGAIAALRGDTAAAAGNVASITISLIARDDIRPVATSLGAGATARLVIAAGQEAVWAECLLSYDPKRIDDDAAANLLLAFKGAIEHPLRLIA